MKTKFCVLMCVVLASMANAFTITNGDFETGGGENIPDVTGWYDNSTANFWENAWQTNASWITPNGTSTGESEVIIGFDWGHPDDTGTGRHDGMTIAAYASDGTFVAEDAADINSAAGVTLLDSASYDHVRVGQAGTHGEIWTEVVTLDLSGASAGDEIFLRFNNYLPAAGADPWPVLDNVEIIPEPATLALLGLGGLLLRKRK